jgi:large subunit ribosomal protein L9
VAGVKVILSEDVANLGDAGEVVSVRPGYARNYLIPKRMAILATESSVKELEHHKRAIAEKLAKERKAQEAERARIEALELETTVQAGEEGRLFGSVTAMQIAELLAEKGVEIDRRRIDLPEPIKETGDHVVRVKLHRDVVANVRLKVVAAA